MGNIIDSFLVLLGFEVEDSGAKAYQEDMEKITLSLTAVGAAAVAAAAGIGLFVSGIAASLDDLGDFAEREDYSVEKLQELGYAAQLTGSDLNAVKTSLSAANRVIGEAALGIGRGAMTFKKLNLEVKNADGTVKTFDDILSEVADRMEGMSNQEAIAMAEKLGLDRGLIPLLKRGSAGIKELTDEAREFGISSEKDIETAGLFQDSMDRTRFVLRGLANTIGVGLMPTVKRFIDGLRDWIKQNKELIRTNLTRFLNVVSVFIGTLFEYIMRLVGGLTSAVEWLLKFKVAVVLATTALALLIGLQVYRWTATIVSGLRGATLALMRFNLAALLIPAIIGLIIIAVGLLIDEFINFKEGNESFLGDLVAEYPVLLDVINSISDGIAAALAWLQQLWDRLEPALSGLATSLLNLFVTLWPAIKFFGVVLGQVLLFGIGLIADFAEVLISTITFAVDVLVLVITGLLTAFTVVVDGITTSINFMTSMFTSAAEAVQQIWNAVFDWFASKFDAVVGRIIGAAKWVGNLIGLADSSTNGGLSAAANGAATEGGVMPSVFQSSGGLGVAAQPSAMAPASQNTTQVNTGDIIVQSPDPAKAGQNVKDVLNDTNRQAVRNGQSAVEL